MERITKVCIVSIITALICFSGIACKETRETADDVGQSIVINSTDRANALKLRSDLQTINRSMELFHAQFGRYPDSLDELARKGALPRIPREPFGGEWNYDPSTGQVTSSSHPEYGTNDDWDGQR